MSLCHVPAVPQTPWTLEQRQAQRDMILACERRLYAAPGVLLNGEGFPLFHRFADGCYIRELHIPQGCLYVGSLHKYSHPRFLLTGRLLVVTEFGPATLHVAPSYMITSAGTKRVGLALEDTVVVTVHATTDTDVDAIEAAILAPDYATLDAFLALQTTEKDAVLALRAAEEAGL